MSYDAAGNRLTETDRRGILSTFSYDAANRLVETTRAGLRLETREYDAAGNLSILTDAKSYKTGYEYDERALLIAENLPLTGITRFQRGAMGDVLFETDPVLRVTERVYDRRRRLKRETNFAGELTLFEYDANGNQTARVLPKAEADPELFRWEYDFDDADRLVAVRDPLDNLTEYVYDKNSNRTLQRDAETRETGFAYDELDRLFEMTYPDTSSESYGYDPNGNLIDRTDPEGLVYTSDYDEVDRPALSTYPARGSPGTDELETVVTTYDPNGNMLSVLESYSGPTGDRLTSNAYDDFDRLEIRTDTFGKILTYGYDANGNRDLLRDPDNLLTRYDFDDLNRLQTVTVFGPPGSSTTEITTYDYYSDSRLRSVNYPGALETRHIYDAVGRLESLTNTHDEGGPGGPVVVSSFGYEYDLNGNRTDQRETNGGDEELTTYEYDDADRLLQVVYPDKTTTYTYDAVGNRSTEYTTTEDPGGGTVVLTDRIFDYNHRHQLEEIQDQTVPNGDSNIAYTYDLNGNQTSKTQFERTTFFTFDNRDRIAHIEKELEGGGKRTARPLHLRLPRPKGREENRRGCRSVHLRRPKCPHPVWPRWGNPGQVRVWAGPVAFAESC